MYEMKIYNKDGDHYYQKEEGGEAKGFVGSYNKTDLITMHGGFDSFAGDCIDDTYEYLGVASISENGVLRIDPNGEL